MANNPKRGRELPLPVFLPHCAQCGGSRGNNESQNIIHTLNLLRACQRALCSLSKGGHKWCDEYPGRGRKSKAEETVKLTAFLAVKYGAMGSKLAAAVNSTSTRTSANTDELKVMSEMTQRSATQSCEMRPSLWTTVSLTEGGVHRYGCAHNWACVGLGGTELGMSAATTKMGYGHGACMCAECTRVGMCAVCVWREPCREAKCFFFRLR